MMHHVRSWLGATGRLSQLTAIVCAAWLQVSHVAAAEVSHEMGKIKTGELREVSGLAASRTNPNVLWLHNDGTSGQLFALSTTGKLVAIVRCDAAIADLEDIAIGPGPQSGIDYLYLGDIGDNSLQRGEVRVLRFVEPKLAGERGQQLAARDVEVFRLAYPDGPHDAETLLVDPASGDILIVTKEKHGARLYGVDGKSLKNSAKATLLAAGTASVDQVSAGSISADGGKLILRRENQGWLWHRAAGESVTQALAKQPRKIDVQGKRQGPNGESVSFSPSGDSYYTVSEGKKQPLYRFDLPRPESSAQGQRD